MSEAKSWKEFFENFSYKPNWSFKFQEDPQGEFTNVIVKMKVPDSRSPLPEPTPLDHLMGQRTVIPLIPITKVVFLGDFFPSEQYALDYIFHHIQDMEMHEIGEWFRYKGELPFDPHKEG